MMRPDESDTETSAAVDLEPLSSKPEKDSEKEHEGSQTTEEEQPSLIFAQQVSVQFYPSVVRLFDVQVSELETQYELNICISPKVIDLNGPAIPSLRSPKEVFTQTDCCVGCGHLVKEMRKIRNKYVTLKGNYEATIKAKRTKGEGITQTNCREKPV